jgi:CBS domain-containing protein
MLSANGEPLTVVDDDGHVEGLFTLTLVERLLADDNAEPYAPGDSAPAAVQPATPGREA